MEDDFDHMLSDPEFRELIGVDDYDEEEPSEA
jgi:hypothetical protein